MPATVTTRRRRFFDSGTDSDGRTPPQATLPSSTQATVHGEDPRRARQRRHRRDPHCASAIGVPNDGSDGALARHPRPSPKRPSAQAWAAIAFPTSAWTTLSMKARHALRARRAIGIGARARRRATSLVHEHSHAGTWTIFALADRSRTARSRTTPRCMLALAGCLPSSCSIPSGDPTTCGTGYNANKGNISSGPVVLARPRHREYVDRFGAQVVPCGVVGGGGRLVHGALWCGHAVNGPILHPFDVGSRRDHRQRGIPYLEIAPANAASLSMPDGRREPSFVVRWGQSDGRVRRSVRLMLPMPLVYEATTGQDDGRERLLRSRA